MFMVLVIDLLRDIYFSNSLIIHKPKTKEITTVKEVWICGLNYWVAVWQSQSENGQISRVSGKPE